MTLPQKILLPLLLSISMSSFAKDITITHPSYGDTLSGIINIEAMVTDTSNVERVEFQWAWVHLRNNLNLIGVDNQPPFNIEFDSGLLRNDREYFIEACAYSYSQIKSCRTVTRLAAQNPDTRGPDIRHGLRLFPNRITDPVHGTELLSARANDESDIAFVDFYLEDDGTFLGRVTEANRNDLLLNPYSIEWDSTTVDNGVHRLSLVTQDVLGNETRIDSIGLSQGVLIVENTYAPTNLIARSKGYHLNLKWSGSPQEESYAVFRRLESETEFTHISDTDFTVLVDDLPIEEEYADYFVKAVYQYRHSDPSEIIRVYPNLRSRRR